jgi:hypothetical protein
LVIPVHPDDRTTQGLRICESKPLLLVSPAGTQIILVPNHSRTYAVQFVAFLAKSESSTQLEQGCVVKQMDVKLDTTAVIDLLKQALEKLAPQPPAGAQIAAATDSNFRIYEFIFDDAGNLIQLRRVPVRNYSNARGTLK